jgi:hypothetical protein
MHRRKETTLSLPLLIQSGYYLFTGIWPLLSMRTFEMITGPKQDKWLVKTVGVLVSVIGVVLGLAALRPKPPFEIRTLAVGSALGLTIIDIVYVARGRIARIYLLDAALELILIAALFFFSGKRSGRTSAMRRQMGGGVMRKCET